MILKWLNVNQLFHHWPQIRVLTKFLLLFVKLQRNTSYKMKFFNFSFYWVHTHWWEWMNLNIEKRWWWWRRRSNNNRFRTLTTLTVTVSFRLLRLGHLKGWTKGKEESKYVTFFVFILYSPRMYKAPTKPTLPYLCSWPSFICSTLHNNNKM